MRIWRLIPLPPPSFPTPHAAIAHSQRLHREHGGDERFQGITGSTVTNVCWSDDLLRIDAATGSLLIRPQAGRLNTEVVAWKDGPRPAPSGEPLVLCIIDRRSHGLRDQELIWRQDAIAAWLVGRVLTRIFYNGSVLLHRGRQAMIGIHLWAQLEPAAGPPWVLHWSEGG